MPEPRPAWRTGLTILWNRARFTDEGDPRGEGRLVPRLWWRLLGGQEK